MFLVYFIQAYDKPKPVHPFIVVIVEKEVLWAMKKKQTRCIFTIDLSAYNFFQNAFQLKFLL